MGKKPEETKVIIAGGGIGGLTTALCLHRAGFKVVVYERAPMISELGVGINLLPHANRVLHGLGLQKELDEIGVPTTSVQYISHKGDLIYSEQRGANSGQKYPQYSIHRGKLQLVLLQAATKAIGAENIITDHELVRFDQDEEGVTCYFKSGLKNEEYPAIRGDLLIGVDGIKSTVRSLLYPKESHRFTGWVIWRGAVETDQFLDGKTMAIVGKGDTLIVLYPIDNTLASKNNGKSLVNWGALRNLPDGPTDENWQKRGNKEDILPIFKEWKLDWINLEKVISETEVVMEYAMHDRNPVSQWSFGRVTLAGDAAHPLLPFGSQGACQAILDAEALEQALFESKETGNYVEGLKNYEKKRVEIAREVVETNRLMGPTRILKVFEENPNTPKEDFKKISLGYAVTSGSLPKI